MYTILVLNQNKTTEISIEALSAVLFTLKYVFIYFLFDTAYKHKQTV